MRLLFDLCTNANANYKDNESSGILFHLDLHPRTHIPTLRVQSRQKPNWDFLLPSGVREQAPAKPDSELSDSRVKNYLLGENDLPLEVKNPDTKKIDLRQLREGQLLSFRLRANPTKRVNENAKHIGLIREEDQQKWLERKLESAGAAWAEKFSFNYYDP